MKKLCLILIICILISGCYLFNPDHDLDSDPDYDYNDPLQVVEEINEVGESLLTNDFNQGKVNVFQIDGLSYPVSAFTLAQPSEGDECPYPHWHSGIVYAIENPTVSISDPDPVGCGHGVEEALVLSNIPVAPGTWLDYIENLYETDSENSVARMPWNFGPEYVHIDEQGKAIVAGQDHDIDWSQEYTSGQFLAIVVNAETIPHKELEFDLNLDHCEWPHWHFPEDGFSIENPFTPIPPPDPEGCGIANTNEYSLDLVVLIEDAWNQYLEDTGN